MGLPWLMNDRGERSASSLRVWIPLAFAVFVLLGTVGLLLVFGHRQKAEEREAFEELARVNADFMVRTRLPRTQQMASRLSEVLGAQVYFRKPDSELLLGPEDSLSEAALNMAQDGSVTTLPDGQLMIGITDEAGVQMIFVREQRFRGIGDLGSDAWLAMGLFWLLSIGLGFGVSRWISSPLQSLVKALPKVGTTEALPPLPIHRRDEIGSLARVLEDTHRSLGEERERRRQAERLALLGRMATGIAHEIRNPAAAIQLHAELMDASDPEGFSKSRNLILDEAKRLEGLVSQWMHYSRPEPPKTDIMELGAMLREVVEVMKPQATHMNVELELSLADEQALKVEADRHRLHQVFTNLTLNAIQAMPKGGRVEIKVEEVDGKVSVELKDGGPGFSDKALESALDPFFSEREGGLGLGLAVAAEICKAHGGTLAIGNLESGGACIRVELPKSKPQNGGHA